MTYRRYPKVEIEVVVSEGEKAALYDERRDTIATSISETPTAVSRPRVPEHVPVRAFRRRPYLFRARSTCRFACGGVCPHETQHGRLEPKTEKSEQHYVAVYT